MSLTDPKPKKVTKYNLVLTNESNLKIAQCKFELEEKHPDKSWTKSEIINYLIMHSSL